MNTPIDGVVWPPTFESPPLKPNRLSGFCLRDIGLIVLALQAYYDSTQSEEALTLLNNIQNSGIKWRSKERLRFPRKAKDS